MVATVNIDVQASGGAARKNRVSSPREGGCMRNFLFIVCALAFLGARAVSAQESTTKTAEHALEVSFSNTVLEGRYLTPTSIGRQEDSQMAYTVFLSEERDVVGSAELMVKATADIGLGSRVQLRFGPKAYIGLL